MTTTNTAPVFTGVNVLKPTIISGDGIDLGFQGSKVIAGLGNQFYVLGNADQQAALIRYNIDGTPDSSFGVGGYALFRMNPNNSFPDIDAPRNRDFVFNLLQLDDGKVLIGIFDYTNFKGFVYRLNSNGQLDTTYGGGDGKVTVNSPYAASLHFNSDGSFIFGAAGFDDFGESYLAKVGKFTSGGVFDSSFGVNGYDTYTTDDYGQYFGVVITRSYDTLPNGQTIGYQPEFVLKNADGSIDTTFGNKVKYTEGDDPVQLSSTIVVTDAELDATDYSGATITIMRQGGANPDDVFTSTYTDPLHIFDIVQNSGGMMVVNMSLYGPEHFLKGLRYSNTSDDPEAQVVIDITINDGNTGSQGTGGALSATTSYTINITNVNDVPVVNNQIEGQSVAQDGIFSLTLGSDAFSDADNDTLTYTAILSNGSPLPSWLTFDADTLTFSGTPLSEDVGVLSISLVGTDPSGDYALNTFQLTVTNVNDAPVSEFEADDQYAKEGAAFTFTLPEGMFTDIDTGDILSYSATPLPDWLTFDPVTKTFSGTPSNADVGYLDIKVTAHDVDGLTAFSMFTIDVANVVNGTFNDKSAPLADSMAGGDGSNFYVIDNLKDTITENLNGGTDTAEVGVKLFALSSNVERALVTKAISTTIRGNELANYIKGNAKADTLFGYGVTTPDSSNDTLDGGAGADKMLGGAGGDTYYVDHKKDVVVDSKLDAGVDTVYSSVTYSLSSKTSGGVENLILTGLLNNNATGNALNNTITGNAGDNLINGAAGADALYGGAGNDIYILDNTGDTVVELADSGTDLIRSNSASITMSSNVENATLLDIKKPDGTFTAKALNVTGNDMNNVIIGNLAANQIDAGVGDDSITSAGGNDSIVAGFGNDTINGGKGNDTMIGGIGNDIFFVDSTMDVVTETNGQGTDTIYSTVSLTLADEVENLNLDGKANINATGNELDNVITGNAGKNILKGGTGADTFVFDTKLNAKTNFDKLTDFSLDDGDKIGLSSLIFKSLGDTVEAGELLITFDNKALDSNDFLIYNANNGVLYYDADGSGKGAAVAVASIKYQGLSVSDLAADDFLML